MTPEFLSAVVDTLVPGDDAGVGVPASEARAGAPASEARVGAPATGGRSETSTPLPSATAAGVDAKLAGHLVAGRGRDLHVAALRAIANAAGGEEAFVRADAAERTATVRRVEENVRGAFRALVSLVLEEYYEAEPVLLAMGWSTGPPQPQGHLLAPFDEDLLGPVKRRKPMWR